MEKKEEQEWTLYIGVHSGKSRTKVKPKFSHEEIRSIKVTPARAMQLARALNGVAKYLLEG